jgi:hypothetical protein
MGKPSGKEVHEDPARDPEERREETRYPGPFPSYDSISRSGGKLHRRQLELWLLVEVDLRDPLLPRGRVRVADVVPTRECESVILAGRREVHRGRGDVTPPDGHRKRGNSQSDKNEHR